MRKFLARVRGRRQQGAGGVRPPLRSETTDFRIPVLCYHSWTMESADYVGNDHVALEHDLRTLARRGYTVISLTAVVGLLRGQIDMRQLGGRRLVGLSFDDGRDFDRFDTSDALGRLVRSFYRILREHASVIPRFDDGPMALSFVIASPEARHELDQGCGRGRGEWNDHWWRDCARERILGIGNHSWDHVHEAVSRVRQRNNLKGSFLAVSSFEDAEAQIADAQRRLHERTDGHAVGLFAYPYGHVAPYLRDEYLPGNGERIGILGAFGTGGRCVTASTPIWDIPRLVCGWHWRTRDDFEQMLDVFERECA